MIKLLKKESWNKPFTLTVSVVEYPFDTFLEFVHWYIDKNKELLKDHRNWFELTSTNCDGRSYLEFSVYENFTGCRLKTSFRQTALFGNVNKNFEDEIA